MTAAQYVPDFQHITRVMARVNESRPCIYMSQMTVAQHVPDSQHITRVMAHVTKSRLYAHVQHDCSTTCPRLPTRHACHGSC